MKVSRLKIYEMEELMYFSDLLKGAVDVHLHVGPSLIQRRLDAVEMARKARDAGYKAMVIKDHHGMTAMNAELIKKYLFAEDELQIYGSLVLNNECGGINPQAVKAAIGFGARIIWFPTVASYYHIMGYRASGHTFPKTSIPMAERPILLMDGEDRLLPEVVEVLEVIAEHPEVALATGHISSAEIDVVVEKACELGIKKIMVDHPTYIVNSTVEQMKRWVELGAYIEHIACLSARASNLAAIDIGEIAEVIRAVGPEHTIISSDFGQKSNGDPVEGLDSFMKDLFDRGITKEELRLMSSVNPSKLLGLEDGGESK